MKKNLSNLTVPQARQRLRYENAILHTKEAANHKLYIEEGSDWDGHAQGKELAVITDHVTKMMREAGEAAYHASKKAGEPFRKRRIAIITARNEAQIVTRSNLKVLTDTITEMFKPTAHRKGFPNPIPEEKDGAYQAKALRKWCARTTRVAMLVAEQYAAEHLDEGGDIKHFHSVAKETEEIHDTVHKLRKHIQKLKAKKPVPPPQVPQPVWPAYYPPPGYAPWPQVAPPGHHAHHHHKPNHAAWTTPVEPSVVVHHGARPRRAPKAPAPSHTPQFDAGGG